jgi:hypothetical protein
MPPTNESQTSKNLRALMDLHYIMERSVAVNGTGLVTLRGRRGEVQFSVTEPDDERASAALLAKARAHEGPVR